MCAISQDTVRVFADSIYTSFKNTRLVFFCAGFVTQPGIVI